MSSVPCIPETAPFNAEQRAWVNGFLAGLFSRAAAGAAGLPPEAAGGARLRLLILFGSQTGTAEGLAKRAATEAARHKVQARVVDMNAFASVDWSQERHVLVITSTWGDGDPPDNAVGFWNYLNSEAAPRLEQVNFAVLALGDRNYADFCGAGRKFDARLAQLGATRFHPLAECDVDYESAAKAWLAGIWPALNGQPAAAVDAVIGETEVTGNGANGKGYSKTNPFRARLLANRLLNGPGSAKETRHFEISLKDSGLTYEVGDALGVMPANCPLLTGEILAALNCDGEEAVKLVDGAEVSLRKALLENFQITRIPLPLLAMFAERSKDPALTGLLKPENKTELDKFCYGREIIHLLLAYPQVRFTPGVFAALLTKLQPRLYSIASSPKLHPGEVHLTVAVVRYESHGRRCQGVCSSFLADRVTGETPVPVFVQTSHGFRLPQSLETPIIMVGPGTGVAPFRAFLEERRATGAKGRNWLFFGEQRQATDFLYAGELEAMQRDGHLTRLDTAFSRDQAGKVYVQQRMLENAPEFWSWLEAGAHVYVCGDAKRMAKDVDEALHRVIQAAGQKTAEQAAEYVQRLKQEKRYQRDVY
jgi:sulfite reductase (NADPH) flavoprotein alpha-component